jgi:hypothetical protein
VFFEDGTDFLKIVKKFRFFKNSRKTDIF